MRLVHSIVTLALTLGFTTAAMTVGVTDQPFCPTPTSCVAGA